MTSKAKIDPIKKSLALLPRRQRVKYLFALAGMTVLTAMDFMGVVLVSLVAMAAVNGSFNNSRLPIFLPSGITETRPNVLLFFGLVLFVVKSCLSVWINLKISRFLAHQDALSASGMAKRLIDEMPLLKNKLNSQQMSHAIVQGSSFATTQILLAFSSFVSEVALQVAMLGLLFFADPILTFIVLILFGLVMTALHFFVSNKSETEAVTATKADVRTAAIVDTIYFLYREIKVGNRAGYFAGQIEKERWKAAKARAVLNIISAVPKYVLDVAFVIGILTIALYVAVKPSAHVAALPLFLVATSRMLPSLLRLQGSLVALRTAFGFGTSTFELNAALAPATSVANPPQASDASRKFVAHVVFHGVRFRHSDQLEESISGLSLSIYPGQFVAVVGPSGAGKSTLIDLLLGVLQPTNGEITISGLEPTRAAINWPGKIGYVPQDVRLFEGTVEENVRMGLSQEDVNSADVAAALELARINASTSGLTPTSITTQGSGSLSGGQRQRIGIARALLTRPELLVLDECTSALDAETEEEILQNLLLLKNTTIVMVAHRLSAVRNADRIFYLESGRLLGSGTFTELVEMLPQFASQASLMGLDSD